MSVQTPQHRYVGERLVRVEDPRLLRGRGQYVDDIDLPGMAHAAFVRSPFPHARINGIDVEAALALDGVFGIFTGKDLNHLAGPLIAGRNDYGGATLGSDLLETKRQLLAADKARHVGDAVAVVVARDRYLAEDACELVHVDWEPLPAVVDANEALSDDSPRVDEALASNNIVHKDFETGDVQAAMDSAPHVFRKRFHHGRCHPAPLEPRGIIADWTTGADRGVTVWISHQMAHLMRTYLSELLQMPEGRLRVIVPDVGGGFGLKAHLFTEDVVIPLVSRALDRPVKWIEDRYENLAASNHAREVFCDIEAAADDDGRLLALRMKFLGDVGAYSPVPYTPWIDVGMAAKSMLGSYDIDNVGYTTDAVLTNKCPTGAYRGVGQTVGQCARESIVDDVARKLDIDPFELRLRNCIGDEPRVNPIGPHHYDGGSYAECLRKARDVLGYDELRERQLELREQGRYIGIGICNFMEHGAWGSKTYRAHGADRPFIDLVRLTVEPGGSVVVATGLTPNGQGHETTFAQLAADALGADLEQVRVVQADTERTPFSMGTRGSRSGVVGSGAILRAAEDLREKMAQIAAHQLEAAVEDIEFGGGKASVRGAPSQALTFREIAQIAYFAPEKQPEDIGEPALVSTRSYDPDPTYGNGTVVAVVEVDVKTGIVKTERIVFVEDCGVVLNPMIVDGQIAGGVAQGIGQSLLEQLAYDVDGQLLSGTLKDFLYPTAGDVPSVEIAHVVTPSPATTSGMKGVAESGIIATPAAVVNAVADALSPFSVEVDHTPITPNDVRALLRAAQASSQAATT